MRELLTTIITVLTVSTLVFSQSDEYNRYVVGIHFDSDISGGYFSPEKLVEFAIENELDAIIFCDHDRMSVEYGIPPLRNLIKKRVEYPSILTHGPDNYLKTLDSLQQNNPQLSIIPGAEVAPAYYWVGNIFEKNLELFNWHQHMMVIGLEDPADYHAFPSSAANIRQGYDTRLYFDIAAVVGVLVGLLLFRKVVTKTMQFSSGQLIKVRRRPFKFTGILLTIFCIALLINDYPFTARLYSPYGGDPNPEATQALIDYVLERNGLVYFAHPEAEFHDEFSGIEVRTEPYTNLLPETDNYTGFAVFGEGFHRAGIPGGEWDKTLNQYIDGRRENPTWAIGEVDFEGDLPAECIKEVSTFVWAKENTKEAVLDALAKGRCYSAQIYGPKFIWLDEWNIAAPSGEVSISGETLNADSSVTLHFNFTAAEDKSDFEALILRNGVQLSAAAFDESTQIDFEDTPLQGKSYYRLWVLYRGYPVLAANPIFVNRL